MNTDTRMCYCLACGVALVVGLAATAPAQHADIFVTTLPGSTTGIGAADVDGGAFEVDTRVFESVLIAGLSPDYGRDEPGFFALSDLAPAGLFPPGASPLPANSLASFAFHSFTFNGNTHELFYWNGVGAVDFQPAAFAEVSLSEAVETTTDHGALDFHPAFQIDNPAGAVAGGVYLASLRATVAGLAPSEPIFLVALVDSSITNEFLAEEAEEAIEAGTAFQFFEQAVAHVEASLVPEPSSLAIGLLGAVGLLLGGRRYAAGR